MQWLSIQSMMVHTNSPMNVITCPQCGQEIEISSALSKQYEEQLKKELHTKHQKDLEEAKKQAIEESNKKMRDEFELQMKKISDDAASKEERNRELIEQITELTKQMREMRKEKDEVMLTMQKKLSEEEGKIRTEAQKKAEEEQRTKLLEKDKQLLDTLKELEDAKRKLTQGSQQAQGEVFEQEFEQLLGAQYPHDKIIPVSKGTRGGDVLQEVWDRNGVYAGKIIWELKNTKTWSEPWIDKLKVDKRAAGADEAVIISEHTS